MDFSFKGPENVVSKSASLTKHQTISKIVSHCRIWSFIFWAFKSVSGCSNIHAVFGELQGWGLKSLHSLSGMVVNTFQSKLGSSFGMRRRRCMNKVSSASPDPSWCLSALLLLFPPSSEVFVALVLADSKAESDHIHLEDTFVQSNSGNERQNSCDHLRSPVRNSIYRLFVLYLEEWQLTCSSCASLN